MKPRRIYGIDPASAALTLVLAVLSIYAASFPVVDAIFFILFVLAWPFAALLWAITLLVPSVADSTNRAFSVLTAVLMALTAGSVLFLGFLALPIALLVASLTIVGYVVAARRRARRVGWSISPVIVIATIALLYAGIPRQVRFGLAEPTADRVRGANNSR